MKKVFVALMVLLSLQSVAQSLPSAAVILSDAGVAALKDKKSVFLLFHASWCGWCHKMDTAMADPSIQPLFDKAYVIRHLTVYEKEDSSLDNPGARELLKKYHGEELGIPYWMIFDGNGKLLADSKMGIDKPGIAGGQNTGCPASVEEVEHFIKALKKSSDLDDAQLDLIRKRFRKIDPAYRTQQ